MRNHSRPMTADDLHGSIILHSESKKHYFWARILCELCVFSKKKGRFLGQIIRITDSVNKCCTMNAVCSYPHDTKNDSPYPLRSNRLLYRFSVCRRDTIFDSVTRTRWHYIIVNPNGKNNVNELHALECTQLHWPCTKCTGRIFIFFIYIARVYKFITNGLDEKADWIENVNDVLAVERMGRDYEII